MNRARETKETLAHGQRNAYAVAGKVIKPWRRKMSHEKISKVTQVGSEYLSSYSVKN